MPVQPLIEVLSLDDPTDGSLADLAVRLRVLRESRKPLSDLEAALELEVMARMEEDTMELPGVGRARRFKRESSTWRDTHSSAAMRADIRSAIARRVALDRISGEVNQLYENVALQTMELAWDVIPAFSSFKAAGRKLGLDIEDYRIVSEVDAVAIEQSVDYPD